MSEAETLRGTIEAAFAGLIERGEIDVVPGEDGAGLELQADEWTLALDGDPPTAAFLAIDDEPASAEEMGQALEGVMEPDGLEALRSLDRALDGSLRAALQASGDMLSLELASLLAEAP